MRGLLVLITFLFISATGLSKTIHVPGDHSTIQAAIDASVNGDTVLVHPGTYVENIDFKGNSISLESEQGPNVTVIDGGNPAIQDYGSVVIFQNGEKLDTVLEGFTLKNGSGTFLSPYYYGGGIFCDNSSPTIMNNIIEDNICNWGGGIACVFDASPKIINNIIKDNLAESNNEAHGGGIGCFGNVSPEIVKNIINKNSAIGIHMHNVTGGGIGCYDGASPSIINNVISENYTTNHKPNAAGGCGAGIIVAINSTAVIRYNVITGNSGDNTGGIEVVINSSAIIEHNIISNNQATNVCGGILCSSSNATIQNNIIFGNNANYGGGIYCSQLSYLSISNNTICGNSVMYKGGGIDCTGGSKVDVINTILWNNNATNGPEIHLWGNSSTVTISYSDVEGGKSSCDVEPGSTLNWGSGMIDSDPLFVDEANGDFHLTYHSPCKDTGDNTAVTEPYDFEGDPRIAYGTVDMGADEFYTHLYWTGDATPGGNVEIKFVGLPGTSPVGLCIGTGVLDPPIKSMWGDWYLKFPIFGPMDLGSITSPEGVLVIPGTIPATPPPPYSLPMQALIGAELTNLAVLEVK